MLVSKVLRSSFRFEKETEMKGKKKKEKLTLNRRGVTANEDTFGQGGSLFPIAAKWGNGFAFTLGLFRLLMRLTHWQVWPSSVFRKQVPLLEWSVQGTAMRMERVMITSKGNSQEAEAKNSKERGTHLLQEKAKWAGNVWEWDSHLGDFFFVFLGEWRIVTASLIKWNARWRQWGLSLECFLADLFLNNKMKIVILWIPCWIHLMWPPGQNNLSQIPRFIVWFLSN